MKESCPKEWFLLINYCRKKQSLPRFSEKALSEILLHLPAVTKPTTIGTLTPASAVIPARPAVFATTKTTVAAEATLTTTPATALPAPATESAATAETSTTTAVTTATIESSTTCTTFTIFHRAGFINHNLPRPNGSPVHFQDGCLGLLIGSHFHEPKALGPAGHLVHDYFRAIDLTTGSEKLLQLQVCRLERQASDV